MLSVPNSISHLPPASLRRLPELRQHLPFLELHLNHRAQAKCSSLATTSPAPEMSKNSITGSQVFEEPEELDYSEAAVALENIYQLSQVENSVEDEVPSVVKNSETRAKRLGLNEKDKEKKKMEKLVREYSAATELSSIDWEKMKVPPRLKSAEQKWLFELMQPMKALYGVKETLKKDLGREPTDAEVASAVNMSVPEMQRRIEVGTAARNKLIKHNLRLVLFVMKKYFPEYSSGEKFQELCQAGAMGLITAIDSYKPKRAFRLSTYALFWIRHYIVRSRHFVTQGEHVNGIADIDRAEADKNRQTALLQLALDDEVLIWLLGEKNGVVLEKLANQRVF